MPVVVAEELRFLSRLRSQVARPRREATEEQKSTVLWVHAVRRQEWQRVAGWWQFVKKSPVVRRVMRYVPMVEIPVVSGGGKLGDGRRGQNRRRRNLQIQMKSATELQRSRRIDQMRHEGSRFKPSDARLVSFPSELAKRRRVRESFCPGWGICIHRWGHRLT